MAATGGAQAAAGGAQPAALHLHVHVYARDLGHLRDEIETQIAFVWERESEG